MTKKKKHTKKKRQQPKTKKQYLQPVITQYFVSYKSEIWA